jgi:hypothetical protein
MSLGVLGAQSRADRSAHVDVPKAIDRDTKPIKANLPRTFTRRVVLW